MATEKVYYGTGRRKSSTARVFLKPGKGTMLVNGKKADDYLQPVCSYNEIQQVIRIEISASQGIRYALQLWNDESTFRARLLLHPIKGTHGKRRRVGAR
jgi:hypothetical protein